VTSTIDPPIQSVGGTDHLYVYHGQAGSRALTVRG